MSSTPDNTEGRLRTELQTYMARRGLRSTEQRRLIIDSFFDSHEHVTLDELLTRVRQDDPRIGYATVYRTMKLLSEAGIVHELAETDTHHDHLICMECGNITEFEEPLIEELQERIAARHGFLVKEHKHELYGVCNGCQGARRLHQS